MQRDGIRDGMSATPLDRRLAELAGRQYGVVSAGQIAELGLSGSGLRSRIASGRLHRIHHGVFAVGHRVLRTEGRYMAAVLSCGGGAVLSHRSAAAHWGIRRSDRERVEVTTRRGARSQRRVDVHTTRWLPASHTDVLEGIPVSAPHRTLLDLAEVLTSAQLRRAVDQADVLGLLDHRSCRKLLLAAAGRHGLPRLAAALAASRDGPRLTRSELEERVLRLLDSAGLPRPEVNAIVAAGAEHFEVDFLWRRARLIVEADGHASHRTRMAFERDRTRDRVLTETGWRVVRVTWRQVTDEPGDLARSLGRLLSVGPPE